MVITYHRNFSVNNKNNDSALLRFVEQPNIVDDIYHDYAEEYAKSGDNRSKVKDFLELVKRCCKHGNYKVITIDSVPSVER